MKNLIKIIIFVIVIILTSLLVELLIKIISMDNIINTLIVIFFIGCIYLLKE